MINKVTLVGNLGRDPELRYTQNSNPVCNLNIATTRRVKRGEEWEDETEWHRVVVWGKQAEHCNNYLSKGRQVYVEGRLQTRDYEDKDGVKKYSTDVVAHEVKFLGKKGDGDSSSGHSSAQTPAPAEDDVPF